MRRIDARRSGQNPPLYEKGGGGRLSTPLIPTLDTLKTAAHRRTAFKLHANIQVACNCKVSLRDAAISESSDVSLDPYKVPKLLGRVEARVSNCIGCQKSHPQKLQHLGAERLPLQAPHCSLRLSQWSGHASPVGL